MILKVSRIENQTKGDVAAISPQSTPTYMISPVLKYLHKCVD